MADTFPPIIVRLAQEAKTERVKNPKPLAWRKEGASYIIVFEDGRKLIFDQDAPEVDSAVIDFSDGVDDTEATIAGKTLAKRKKGK